MKINFTTVNTGGFKPVEGGPSRPVDPSDAQLVEDKTIIHPSYMKIFGLTVVRMRINLKI